MSYNHGIALLHMCKLVIMNKNMYDHIGKIECNTILTFLVRFWITTFSIT